MVHLHAEDELDLAQLLHLELALQRHHDLVNLFVGLGGDDHVVYEQADVHVVVLGAYHVDALVGRTAAEADLHEHRVYRLVPRARGLL